MPKTYEPPTPDELRIAAATLEGLNMAQGLVIDVHQRIALDQVADFLLRCADGLAITAGRNGADSSPE